MSFIYPNFLWALLFIAVPIIIHIVNLRRHKVVYFSNVNLLKQVKKETHRKSKLKQLLILSCRILMITALVFAFAKPYIQTGNIAIKNANNIVEIYLDNSFSMNAEGSEGKAIESAKQKAYAIVNNSLSNTKFALLTNNLTEQQNRFYSKNEIVQLIAEVEESHQTVQLSTIVTRFKNMTDKMLLETNKSLYFISDFQKNSFDVENLKADTAIAYNFLQIPINKVQNIYIDTCWFDAPTHHFNQKEILNVKIVNQSDTDYPQLAVNFYLNDSLRALSTVSIEAYEEKTITLEYSNLNKGYQFGKVEIDDYPIIYDNAIYLAYNVKNEIKALLISNDNSDTKNIKAIFANDDYIHLDISSSDKLQISTFDNYSTIFLSEQKIISSGLAEQLSDYVKNGGTLVVIPGTLCNINSYNKLLSNIHAVTFENTDTVSIPISEVMYSHNLFNDVFSDSKQKVDLPTIKYRYRFTPTQQIAETAIFKFADNSTALSATKYEAGNVYVFAFPISNNENGFKNHLLFLPTFYNMALLSDNQQNIYHTIGTTTSIDIKLPQQGAIQNFKIKHPENGNEFIPTITQQHGKTVSIAIPNNFDAGFYNTLLENKKINGFAFNYQLKESQLNYFSKEEIQKALNEAGIKQSVIIETKGQDITDIIQEIDNGKQLWRIFILLALVFILIEAAIIKLWK